MRFAERSKAAIGEYDDLLTVVSKLKLRLFCHGTRSFGLANYFTGYIERKKKKRWEDRIKECTRMDFARSA